ncbi:MAG: DUF4190 domain-containing protein [Polyangiaceae bacterium]
MTQSALINCPACQAPSGPSALSCEYCGKELRRAGAADAVAVVAARSALAVSSTNSAAVISLIAGVLGWSLLPVVATPVAIILGHIARGQIKRTGQGGDGFAIAGLVLGYLQVLLAVVAVVIMTILGVGLFALAGK